MKIAILGSGNVGGSLGRIWAGKGHAITFGSRDPNCERVQALLASIPGEAKADLRHVAAADAEVVVLAVPWASAEGTVREAGDLAGKILVDCINPIAPEFDRLDTGEHGSASEAIAQWAPGARIVKAFNCIGALNFEKPKFGVVTADSFICGDDDAAKAAVKQLSEEMGFEAVDVGGISNAVHLEHVAMLWIHMAYNQGFGGEIAVKVLSR